MAYKTYFQITSSDKKNIEKYANEIDCVVVNANIAVFRKKAIIGYALNNNLELIIDPMTYMLQAGPKFLVTKDKNSKERLKPSLEKVLKEIYSIDTADIDLNSENPIITYFRKKNVIFNDFLKGVYVFQKNYFKSKDLGLFGKNIQIIKMISAPYFDVLDAKYLDLNRMILVNKLYQFDIFRIIISHKTQKDLLPRLIEYINNSNIKIVEIWVDSDEKPRFKDYIEMIGNLQQKILFRYVSFQEIVMIRNQFINKKTQVEGFVTAFGYGEGRKVYPIGGGLPINKIYSLWERKRVGVTSFFDEIEDAGFKWKDRDAGKFYLKNVCNCKICNEIISLNGVQGLALYAEFGEYDRKLRNGMRSKRVLATQNAITLTNFHYIENKLAEYDDFYSDLGFDGDNKKWYKRYFDKNHKN